MNKITDTTSKRNSSVELFRIIATLLVLMVHFNGWFVGMPEQFEGFTAKSIGQTIIESISCICVNCFLVITGWYGLRLKWRHIIKIWSIIVWVYVPFYLVMAIYNNDFSLLRLAYEFIAIGKESYYVQCYLMLMLLSPILNVFIDKYGRKSLPLVLIFWAIEFLLDCIFSNKSLGFAKGYELTHFVFIYLLIRTARLYDNEIKQWYNVQRATLILVCCTLIIASLYIAGVRWAFAYTNPLNILMAFTLFYIFEHRKFTSRYIDWFSSSTLSVYIAHVTPPLINILWEWDNHIIQTYPYWQYLILMLATIIIVFISVTLYDKIRELIFDRINNSISSWIEKKTSIFEIYDGK